MGVLLCEKGTPAILEKASSVDAPLRSLILKGLEVVLKQAELTYGVSSQAGGAHGGEVLPRSGRRGPSESRSHSDL